MKTPFDIETSLYGSNTILASHPVLGAYNIKPSTSAFNVSSFLVLSSPLSNQTLIAVRLTPVTAVYFILHSCIPLVGTVL